MVIQKKYDTVKQKGAKGATKIYRFLFLLTQEHEQDLNAKPRPYLDHCVFAQIFVRAPNSLRSLHTYKWLEQRTENPCVGGSNPLLNTIE